MKTSKQIVLDAINQEWALGVSETISVYINKELFCETEKDPDMVVGLVRKYTGISSATPCYDADAMHPAFTDMVDMDNECFLPDHVYDNEALLRDIDELVFKTTKTNYYYRNKLQFDLSHKRSANADKPRSFTYV